MDLNGALLSVLVLRKVVKAPGGRAWIVIAMANWLGSCWQLLGGWKGKLATGFAMVG